jgi:hypothetical protein
VGEPEHWQLDGTAPELYERYLVPAITALAADLLPEQTGSLREMWRVLASKGRLALSVYSSIEHTPAAKALADALDRHLGPGASKIKRSEHALADAHELRELVAAAGFRGVTIDTTTPRIQFSSPREYVRLQIAATPMAELVSGMRTDQRDWFRSSSDHKPPRTRPMRNSQEQSGARRAPRVARGCWKKTDHH